jgi:hypothetical protein
MPGLKLLTKLDPQTCLKVAYRAAQDLGFSLPPLESCGQRFTATKGSALMSVLAGWFTQQHCAFEISVAAYNDANEVVLEKNTPWLSGGSVGITRVNREAEELVRAIGCAIEKAGGTILERKEF